MTISQQLPAHNNQKVLVINARLYPSKSSGKENSDTQLSSSGLKGLCAVITKPISFNSLDPNWRGIDCHISPTVLGAIVMSDRSQN